ncbi:hypothetical protein AB6B38_03085 [Glycocaulis abyssi]|uniref:Uncharacterized protein n=1 Tax=Glycocaulis abyssi TaxID=1433403 RepID=A0ABV9NI78_9PROT
MNDDRIDPAGAGERAHAGDDASTADASADRARKLDGQGPQGPQDELLPFINNFHDIFTSLGVIILFVGLAVGAGQAIAAYAGVLGETGAFLSMMGSGLVLAVIALALSALLVGAQRRILPGIVLCLIVVYNIAVLLVIGFELIVGLVTGSSTVDAIQAAGAADAGGEDDGIQQFTIETIVGYLTSLPAYVRLYPLVFALSFLAPALLYYRLFRLPFAGGLAGVGVGLSVIAALVALFPELALVYLPALGLAFGAFLFLAGLVFDMRDPGRTTRLSGTGFWLNLFAAPALLTYSVMIANSGWTLTEYFDQATAQAIGEEFDVTRSAVVTLIVMGAFALVSLLINRRALIVAGLITTGTAIGLLVNESGLGVPVVITFTLVSLGVIVVVLGAAWVPVRRLLLLPFPKTGFMARLFPPVTILE